MEQFWERVDNNWVAIIFFIVAVLEALVNSGLLDVLFPEIGPALKSFLTLLIPIIAAPIARRQAYGKHSVRRIKRQYRGH